MHQDQITGKKINLGIGFVTGRKNFRKVLRTYAYRWKQTSSKMRRQVNLHLFVAYDLEYNSTQIDDYVNIRQDILDILDSVFFISPPMIHNEIDLLASQGILNKKESVQMFNRGYAGKRNIILYYALKRHIDYLIFLDDDEYPLAVTNNHGYPLWSGQDVFACHLKYLRECDVTNGYHCGYISPIPNIEFNENLTEQDFRLFIEAISNDILDWDKLRKVMDNGGVTYADVDVLVKNMAEFVPEISGAKFISGSNLGINLMHPERMMPFFNPPKARGEDTFLGTSLHDRKVVRIPCYTFHDSFSAYSDLLDGVLPLELRRINSSNEKTIRRFYMACLGWVRYKPLYKYITDPTNFQTESAEIRRKFVYVIPKLCEYFHDSAFERILHEYDNYLGSVENHYSMFIKNQADWQKICAYAKSSAY